MFDVVAAVAAVAMELADVPTAVAVVFSDKLKASAGSRRGKYVDSTAGEWNRLGRSEDRSTHITRIKADHIEPTEIPPQLLRLPRGYRRGLAYQHPE